MLSESMGQLLRVTREEAGITRADLARQCGVSLRLLAEFERGARPNVSVETALHLLLAVGISLQLNAPAGETVEITSPATEELARAARRALRRRTWTGEITSLHAPTRDPEPGRTPSERFLAVAEVSHNAYAVAAGRRR